MCQFYRVSNPHTTNLLTIHCCVCVFEVIWPFYYKEPLVRVGGRFSILVSESWKQSTSLVHKEESTSMSAWKHNTGAEQSIVVYCLRKSELSSCLLCKSEGPGGIARHLTCQLVSCKFTHICWHRCWRIYTDGQNTKHKNKINLVYGWTVYGCVKLWSVCHRDNIWWCNFIRCWEAFKGLPLLLWSS